MTACRRQHSNTMTVPDTEATAAEWLIRIERDPSQATRAAFMAWLAADVRNHAAYLRLENVWRQADCLRKLRPLDGAVDENILDSFPVSPTSTRAGRPFFRPVVAGTLAAFIVCLGCWIAMLQSQWQTYKTELGGFQRILLRDGSTALLNTSSEIRVRLTRTGRHVVLSRGEALFTVAKDPHRPFDVEAGGTTVRATGTVFAVRLTEQKEVELVVAEGRVAIDPAYDSAITAGETANVQGHRLRITRIDSSNVARKLAWTHGQLLFDRTTLADAVREFNRYNRHQLVIADPAIAGFQIGGSFDVTDLNSFVAALGTFGIRALSSRPPDDPDFELIRLVGTGSG
jgi:transmembrane sensor